VIKNFKNRLSQFFSQTILKFEKESFPRQVLGSGKTIGTIFIFQNLIFRVKTVLVSTYWILKFRKYSRSSYWKSKKKNVESSQTTREYRIKCMLISNIIEILYRGLKNQFRDLLFPKWLCKLLETFTRVFYF